MNASPARIRAMARQTLLAAELDEDEDDMPVQAYLFLAARQGLDAAAYDRFLDLLIEHEGVKR